VDYVPLRWQQAVDDTITVLRVESEAALHREGAALHAHLEQSTTRLRKLAASGESVGPRIQSIDDTWKRAERALMEQRA
jgi:hypothetical protein